MPARPNGGRCSSRLASFPVTGRPSRSRRCPTQTSWRRSTVARRASCSPVRPQFGSWPRRCNGAGVAGRPLSGPGCRGQAVRMPSRGILAPGLGCWCRLRRIRTRPIWRVSCSAFSRYRSASWCSTARMGAASGPACCRRLASVWTGSLPTRPGGARRSRPVSWKPGRAGRRLRPTRRYRGCRPCRIRTRPMKTRSCRVICTG